MSFSSRRRNYLLTPHRRDGLIEWMKSMLMHSFVLDALDATGADTFSHFETLIDEHIQLQEDSPSKKTITIRPSRLQTLVPTVGTFHTRLPLRKAFEAYNEKHALTHRRHVTISFNELRHILNLAQIMALRGGFEEKEGEGGMFHLMDSTRDLGESSSSPTTHTRKTAPSSTSSGTETVSVVGTLVANTSFGEAETTNPCTTTATTTAANANTSQPSSSSFPEGFAFRGPRLITFDGDQTLYQDGANFSKNAKLATYIFRLLQEGVTLAVVTAAGYEYQSHKYEYRLSGLLEFFQEKGLPEEDCQRFYMFGGECNYLLRLGPDYRLHPVAERGPGGWQTSTQHHVDSPANWKEEAVKELLNGAETSLSSSMQDLKLRARLIRKRRAVGLVPESPETLIPREALDEAVLRVQSDLEHEQQQEASSSLSSLPFCAFNGGRDVWVDVGNKRVGVQILQSYMGIQPPECLHIGDQFLNTGNDYAARSVCPCIWITSPEETTYILKSILRLAEVSLSVGGGTNEEEGEGQDESTNDAGNTTTTNNNNNNNKNTTVDFAEIARRVNSVQQMDVYTGEVVSNQSHSKF